MQIIKKSNSTSLYQNSVNPRFQLLFQNRPKKNNSTYFEDKIHTKNQSQKKHSNQKVNHGLKSTSNLLLQLDISKENKKPILKTNQFKTVSNSQIFLKQLKPRNLNNQMKLIPSSTKQISKKFQSSFNISNNQFLYNHKKQTTPINSSNRSQYLDEFKTQFFKNQQSERKKLFSYRNDNMTTKINDIPMRALKQKHRHNNSVKESNFLPLPYSTQNFVLENNLKYKQLEQKNTKFTNQKSNDSSFHKNLKQSKSKKRYDVGQILKGQNIESIIIRTQTNNDFDVKLQKKLKICPNSQNDLNKYIEDLKKNLRNKEEIKIFKKKKEQPKTKSKIIQLGINYKNSTKLIKQHPVNIINNSRFVYGKKLGKGRFGNVYMARDKYTGTLLAIKQIEISSLIESEMCNQLQQQIKIQSFLNHPNILKMYGYFSDKLQVYMLLQLSQGNIFRQLKIAVFKYKQKRFDQKKAAYYLCQVIEAIQYMHKEGVLHRDIKPQNILNSMGVLKLSGSSYLIDFGWSIYSPQKQRNTFCGTLDYVSPQIVTGKQYDFRVDVWSIGVLCYELCTGKAPFQNKNRQQQTYEKIVRTLFNFPQYLSYDVRDFINRILIRDPNKRMTIECALKHKWLIQNSKNIYSVQKNIWNQMKEIIQ